MSDFELLGKYGNLGFYLRCEITNIFVFDRINKRAHNLFTLCVMEDNDSIDSTVRKLTPKLITLSDRFSVGVNQMQVSVPDASCLYQQLHIDDIATCNLGQGDLHLGHMSKLQKQFVQPESTITPLLNKVLKNNFRNGCYILELFDMTKPVKLMLTADELRKTMFEIRKIIPIDLAVVSERIGNIIFQFPAQVVSGAFSTDDDEQCLHLNFHKDKRVDASLDRRYSAVAQHSFDDVLVGHAVCRDIDLQSCSLNLGNTGGINCVQIIDEETGLIVYMQSSSFIRQIITDMSIHAGTRIVGDKRVEVAMRMPFTVGRKPEDDWMEQSRNRQHLMNRKRLEDEMKFIQYGLNGSEREKALNDIRSLIDRKHTSKIYLWDPYLSAGDILDTLYFSKVYGAELRAISSKRAVKLKGDANTSVENWVSEQRMILETKSNNFGVNLVFRLQHGERGFNFHDRFIIFIDDNDIAVAWSLGTSVNSLGKEHHILQEVNNPQHISDAFEELWCQLDSDECLVWPKKDKAGGRNG